MSVGEYLKGMLDILLPRQCAVCGRRLLLRESHICTECLADFPQTYFFLQEHNPMADRFNAVIQQGIEADMDCGQRPRLQMYEYALALYYYKDGYKNLSKGLKYDADIALGRFIAAALGRKVALCSYLADVDLVIPVPLHWHRKLKRGYNQAEIIANEVVRNITATGRECRMESRLLQRHRRTASQALLDVGKKAENVRGAFSLREEKLPSSVRHILIVDDVFTTGSTLGECHRAIRGAIVRRFGPEKASSVRISAATLAFVGD